MTTGHIASGIFESINARFLQPEEVAKSFVLSDHFKTLSIRGHSLAVGPRGSGKTTLLKMLQGQALSSWQHPEAKEYRNRIDYTGVFIPTDVVWAKQIKSLGDGYLSVEQHKLFERAIFTTHILHELVQSMDYRLIMHNSKRGYIHRGVASSDEQEVNLVKGLSYNWNLEPDIYSMISLKQSLMKRMGDIYETVSKERFLNKNGRSERFANISYLHINFLHATISAIEIFSDIFGNKDQRWALLFDELELAPENIVQYLITSLRSVDPRIFFKLSFSPYNENIDLLHNAWAAMPGHDFQYIKLWYPNKDDGTSFSKALVASMLREKNAGSADLTKILGYSLSEDKKLHKKGHHTYGKNTPHVKLFKRMIKNDKSFREYIVRNEIDLDNLNKLSENERARWVRKIYPVALVRDAYRKPDKSYKDRDGVRAVKRRSRKAYSTIFAGTKAMLDMLEGNPRWIIGVIGPLLDIYLRTNKCILKGKQLAEIRKAANQFKSLLNAMPCDVSPKGYPPKSVMSILNLIGDFFSKVVVTHKFQTEPVGSFIVDPNTSKKFQRALALALNAGAIVYIPGTTSSLIIKSLIGRRFRISYLLAPNYHIPIQLMRPTSLRQVLRGSKSAQLSLFDGTIEDKND